jgi:hypothetical protein
VILLTSAFEICSCKYKLAVSAYPLKNKLLIMSNEIVKINENLISKGILVRPVGVRDEI